MKNLIELKTKELRKIQGGCGVCGAYLAASLASWYYGGSTSANTAQLIVDKLTAEEDGHHINISTGVHR